jgi:hypothetical protein
MQSVATDREGPSGNTSSQYSRRPSRSDAADSASLRDAIPSRGKSSLGASGSRNAAGVQNENGEDFIHHSGKSQSFNRNILKFKCLKANVILVTGKTSS